MDRLKSNYNNRKMNPKFYWKPMKHRSGSYVYTDQMSNVEKVLALYKNSSSEQNTGKT